MRHSFIDLSKEEILDALSIEIRNRMLEIFHLAGKGHLGSAFSLVEMLRVLFDEYITFEKDFNNRLIISQGWASLVYYYFLAQAKQIDPAELNCFLKFDSSLGGCIESTVNGIAASTGACGHGLPIGVGLAYAYKLRSIEKDIFVIVGDGELGEGSIWEALMSATRKRLDNLFVIVDYNKVQCSGDVKSITALEPIQAKFESFGFDFYEVNGHCITEISSTLKRMRTNRNGAPKILLSHTVIGKGIPSIENSFEAHWIGKIDNEKQSLYHINE